MLTNQSAQQIRIPEKVHADRTQCKAYAKHCQRMGIAILQALKRAFGSPPCSGVPTSRRRERALPELSSRAQAQHARAPELQSWLCRAHRGRADRYLPDSDEGTAAQALPKGLALWLLTGSPCSRADRSLVFDAHVAGCLRAPSPWRSSRTMSAQPWLCLSGRAGHVLCFLSL